MKEQFMEAIGRIGSMALIHEKMYHDDDMSQIDLLSCMITLGDNIVKSYDTTSKVDMDINTELKEVDLKSIVPISLILNELITNSLKHGLKDGRDGHLVLNVLVNGTKVCFHYSDNGEWIEPKSTSSFGLELISTLTKQMKGEVERYYENGTNFKLTFDKEQFFFKP